MAWALRLGLVAAPIPGGLRIMRPVSNLLDSRERATGDYQSDVDGVEILVGETQARLIIDRMAWPTLTGTPGGVLEQRVRDEGPNSEVIHAWPEISFDGGSTWEFAGGIWTIGGDLFEDLGPLAGSLILTSTLGFGLLQPDNADRRIRVNVECRARITTACHLEFLVTPPPAPLSGHQSVAVVNVVSNNATSGSTLEVASATPSGSDRLIVCPGGLATFTPPTLSSITFGATSVGDSRWDQLEGNNRNFCNSLTAPTAEARTVTFTYSGAPGRQAGGALSFSGVDQTTPMDEPEIVDSGNGSATSIAAITTGATDDIVISAMTGDFGNNAILAEGGDERWNNGPDSLMDHVVATEAGAASVTVGFSTSTGGDYAAVGMNINQVAAGGANPKGPFGHPFRGPFGGPI